MELTNQEIDSIIQLDGHYKNDVLPEDYTEYLKDYDVNWSPLIKKLKERRLQILIVDILDQNVTVPFWMVDAVIDYNIGYQKYNAVNCRRIQIAQARCMANKIVNYTQSNLQAELNQFMLEDKYIDLLITIYLPGFNTPNKDNWSLLSMLSIYDQLGNEEQTAFRQALPALNNLWIPQ